MTRSEDDILKLLGERLAVIREVIRHHAERAGRDPATVRLVAVTKSVSVRVIRLLGQLEPLPWGENRPQSLWAKADALPGQCWHFIGHLQRNKLDRTLPRVRLIHSVDSARLLQAIEAEAHRTKTRPEVLIEFNCSREAAKGGFAPEQLGEVAALLPSLSAVQVRGLMTMAAYADDPEAARPVFRELRQLRDQLQHLTGQVLPELSMGMSGDYPIAVEEGATFVRLGSTLFTGLENE